MKRVFVWISVLIFAGYACTDNNDYETLKAKGLASGKRSDSLFFGLSLNMPVKDFYAACWEKNKAGIFTDGINNQYVLYKLNHNELKHPASMNFYPDFVNEKLYRMRVQYQYDSWAPWNKQFFADSLMQDVLLLYKKWYPAGNDFITLTDPQRGTIYVKIDNNRRITIGKFDDMVVKADITDMLAEQQLQQGATK